MNRLFSALQPHPGEGARPLPASTRQTSAGAVIGYQHPLGIYAWLGVPYAAPPVGPLRWRAPQPMTPWGSLRWAVEPAAPCFQASLSPASSRSRPPEGIGSEDCLYLNIWAPPRPRCGAGLPVMVWLHGGGNRMGNACHYNGAMLACNQNVVVVTVGYRLGMLGWFRHRSLRADCDSDLEQSGNFGTLDTLQALRWVRDNIEAFGGDPQRVTLFGESSGGANVLALLSAPRAHGLFHRAIVQSGGAQTCDPEYAENYADATPPGHVLSSGEILLRLLIDAGRAGDRCAAKRLLLSWSSAATAAFLRSLSCEQLLAAQSTLQQALPQAVATPRLPTLFADGALISAQGITGTLAQRGSPVPVLLGGTRDESALLPPFVRPNRFLRRDLATGDLIVERPLHYRRAMYYLSRFFTLRWVHELAESLSQAGTTPVFVYRFDWDKLQPLPGTPAIRLGATHGLDVPFIFGHLHLGPEFFQLALIEAAHLPAFRKLSHAMMGYWCEFARHGDPTRGSRDDLPRWPAWRTNRARHRWLCLNEPLESALRVEQGALTRDGLLQELATDPCFGSDAERLTFFDDLLAIGSEFGLLHLCDRRALSALIIDNS